LDLKETVPRGVTAPVPPVSTTDALQMVGVLKVTGEGEQVTVVVVVRAAETDAGNSPTARRSAKPKRTDNVRFNKVTEALA
jgi:hypothetical protein